MTDQPPPPPPPSAPGPPPSGEYPPPQPGGYPAPAPGYPGAAAPGGYGGVPGAAPGYPGAVTTTTTGGGGNKTPLIIVAVVVLLALIGGGIFLATRNTGTAVTSPSVTPRPTPTKTATPRPTPTKTARPSSTSTGTANGFIDCTATPAAVDSYTDAAFADVCALDAPRNRLIAALKAKDAAGSRTAAVALQSAAEASGADVATQTPTTDAEKSADSSLKEGLKDVADGSAALVKAIDATDQAAVNAAGTKIDTGTSLLVVVMALLQP